MIRLIIDTHVLIWMLHGHARLGERARILASEALAVDGLMVSAISFWEVAMLTQRQRLRLDTAVSRWRREVLGMGIIELPLTGAIGIAAAEIDDFHPDPADRIITTTALQEDAPLMTADERILKWSGPLKRIDAQR